MKFLAWAVLILAVIWILKIKAKQQAARMARRAEEEMAAARRSASPSIAESELMVSCAHCGVHFPASEAVDDGKGRSFCTNEHLLAHGDH